MDFSGNRLLRQLAVCAIIIAFGCLLFACANIARPGGGPVDEEPPVFVHSKPKPQQLNFKGQKIEIVFNENIKLDKPSEKVVVSPPQISMPLVKSNAKTVTIELKDTLMPNTTYSIEFADAVRDNNEGNPLKDFSFSFSTGDHIDSLQVSGTVLSASNLEPVTGIYVGLQSDLSDSAFCKKPFVRVSKTNELGKFYIHNIAPGSYRIYGLKDINSNYLFDIPSEEIAFSDSIIIPHMEMKIHQDTLWRDSITVDSVRSLDVPHYYPDDILLLSFVEDKPNVYFEKAERSMPQKISLYFSAPEDSLPTIKGLNFNDKDWAIVENSIKNDTVTYWIKDSTLYKTDTLKLSATYLYTDTLHNLVPKTDTLSLFVKGLKKAAEKKNKKSKKKEEADSTAIAFLNVKDIISSGMEIGRRPRFSFDEPLKEFNKEGIRLELKKDSVYILQPSELSLIPGKVRDYELIARYTPGEEYTVTVDSATFVGMYGLHNNTLSKNFSIKKIEEYSNLLLVISNADSTAFVELLNSKDEPIAQAEVIHGEAKFVHIKPGTYYARLILDTNRNGVFDTGDYAQKKQPEKVYYYPDSFNLRANWDVKQEWDILAKPLIKQKPLDITKNKPKEEKKGNELQNQNDNTRQNSQFGGGSISGIRQTFSR